jgi:hypothetical protein
MGDHRDPGSLVDRMGSLKWVPVPSSRMVRVLLTLATLLAVAFLAWLMFQLITLAEKVKENEAKLATSHSELRAQAAQNQRQDEALAEANRRLKAVGEPTVTVPKVIAGPQGSQGPQGATGPQGQTGPTGPAGAKGDAGPTGETGPQGPAGETGPAGADGTNGTDGKDGTSAYPFTFTFTFEVNPAKSTTFTCTLTAPGEVATCTAEESP